MSSVYYDNHCHFSSLWSTSQPWTHKASKQPLLSLAKGLTGQKGISVARKGEIVEKVLSPCFLPAFCRGETPETGRITLAYKRMTMKPEGEGSSLAGGGGGWGGGGGEEGSPGLRVVLPPNGGTASLFTSQFAPLCPGAQRHSYPRGFAASASTRMHVPLLRHGVCEQGVRSSQFCPYTTPGRCAGHAHTYPRAFSPAVSTHLPPFRHACRSHDGA